MERPLVARHVVLLQSPLPTLGQGVPPRINRFEWGIHRRVGPDGERMSGGLPWVVCPEHTLIPERQEFFKRALEQMKTLGFPSGDSTCLLDEFREGEHKNT